MKIRDVVFGVLLILGVLTTAVMALHDASTNAPIVRAYGIVSPCGVYAVIVVRANGASELYTAEHEADSSVEQEVLALPEAKRGGVLVPCAPSASSGVIA